ncbi:unnamed protein product, partial [Prorocentrum cordatum]
LPLLLLLFLLLRLLLLLLLLPLPPRAPQQSFGRSRRPPPLPESHRGPAAPPFVGTAMALNERHKWMAANVAAAFNMSDRVSTIEETLGEYNNLKKLNDFLEGKSKHKHIFIYHQRADMPNDMGELVDAKGEPKTMITTGEHEDMRIKSRAVYFLRNVPDQKEVKKDIACDGELLFGEMAASPLESLNTGLMDVFRPLVTHPGSIDWASCDSEQVCEPPALAEHRTRRTS